MHIIRMRELIGAAGDRVDNLHGLLAGLSLYDAVGAEELSEDNARKGWNGAKDHPLVGYDLNAPSPLQTILPRALPPLLRIVKSISLSPWNPPPYSLRQKGHLLYLQVTTNEGEQHQITSHVSGFYVNKCSNGKFDPFSRPAPKNHSAHSLLTLISHLSPSFDVMFQALQESNHKRDPLTIFPFQNAIPNSPWLVSLCASALNTHQPDITRSQESYLISGVDNAETLRDWNEEFQTTRELPHEAIIHKVYRERLTSKLFADYNDAATRGAVLVARGEVAPLNPSEAIDAQIFVYNNIFYSFGADGVSTFASEGGDEAARVAVGKDVMGIKTVNQLDIPGLYTPGTVVVDYIGKRIVGQSIVPGIFKQRQPGEHQIDYGGIEGKEFIADHPDFVPVFEKLSKALRIKKHPVWDKDGKRHDLEGSIETKGLLGTDGRKYVLDLYRIAPLDVLWAEDEGNSESYPHRMAILRLELVESYWKSKKSQYEKNEEDNGKTGTQDMIVQKRSKKSEEALDQEIVDISAFNLALNPDVFSGQVPQTDEEKEEWVRDEKDVRDACGYLRNEIFPKLIQDLHNCDVGFPMDGQSLTELLHKRGINIRYLGKLANLSREKGQRLQAFTMLVIQEMIARAFKHVAIRYLRHLPFPLAASCTAHLLNCLLGAEMNATPQPNIDEWMREMYPNEEFAFEKVTPAVLNAEIEHQVKIRYRFTLDNEWSSSLRHLQLLRDVAIKLGLQLAAHEYIFDQLPALVDVNGIEGKKKKKKSSDSSSPSRVTANSSADTTFVPDDIVNIVPLVKDASPRSTLAEEAFEAGHQTLLKTFEDGRHTLLEAFEAERQALLNNQKQLDQELTLEVFEAERQTLLNNQKQLGQELILESLTLHEQVYGSLHPEMAKLYHRLSMLYHKIEEHEAAVEFGRKAVIVTERTLGVDSADTILSYLNLSLFEHHVDNNKIGLTYIKHAMDLWKIVYGSNHPDSITTMNNAAVMLQRLHRYPDSRKWFEASLTACEELFGKQSNNTATILFQLAQALALDHDSKAAVNRMRDAYNIFLNELGPNHRNTKEAESWLEKLTRNAVSIAKHAKDTQARRPRTINTINAINAINLSTHVSVSFITGPQPRVGQSASETISRKNDGNKHPHLDTRSIDELIKFIEGNESSSPRSKQKNRTTTNPKVRGSKQSAIKSL